MSVMPDETTSEWSDRDAAQMAHQADLEAQEAERAEAMESVEYAFHKLQSAQRELDAAVEKAGLRRLYIFQSHSPVLRRQRFEVRTGHSASSYLTCADSLEEARGLAKRIVPNGDRLVEVVR